MANNYAQEANKGLDQHSDFFFLFSTHLLSYAWCAMPCAKFRSYMRSNPDSSDKVEHAQK